jgi:hypothetical protein
MSKTLKEAFLNDEAVYYVRFRDLDDGFIKERGAIHGTLDEFTLSDLITEEENGLIIIEEFKLRGEEVE